MKNVLKVEDIRITKSKYTFTKWETFLSEKESKYEEQEYSNGLYLHSSITMAFMNLKGYQLKISMDSDSSESHKRFPLF